MPALFGTSERKPTRGASVASLHRATAAGVINPSGLGRSIGEVEIHAAGLAVSKRNAPVSSTVSQPKPPATPLWVCPCRFRDDSQTFFSLPSSERMLSMCERISRHLPRRTYPFAHIWMMVTRRSIPSFDCIEFGQELFCLIHKDRFQEPDPVPGTGNSRRQIRMKLQTT